MDYNILMYILQVAPLIKLPGALSQSLTYYSPDPVEPGTAVSIEVRTKNVTGIVIVCQLLTNVKQNIRKTTDFSVKEIESVFSEHPLLTPEQLDLATWMSEYYAFPLGVILKSFVPKVTAKMKRYPKILAQERPASSRIQETFQPKVILGGYPERISHYRQTIVASRYQTLILVPDKIRLTQVSQDLADLNPLVISSDLTTKQHREAWMQVKTGQARCIITTRTGIFFPFLDLEQVILEDEPSEAFYSFDMKPQYATQDLARKLAEIHGSNLVLGSQVPSVRSYHLLHQHQISVVPECFPTWKSEQVQVISMLDQYAHGLEGPISDPVINAVSDAVAANRPVIFFVNRRGESTYIYCQDCGHHLRDPHSGSLLVEHRVDTMPKRPKNYTESKVLVSHKSNRWFKMVHVCPKCGSEELHRGGLGIEKIERMIAHLFPAAKTEFLTRDHTLTLESQQEAVAKLKSSESQILFATSMFQKFLPEIQRPLIIIPSAEALLGFPDYTTLERATQLLVQAFTTAHQTLIQTFQDYVPEEDAEPLLYRLARGDISSVLSEEYQEREQFGYPPYTEIIAVHSQHHYRNKALEQALRAKKALRTVGIKALGPLEKYSSKGRGRFVFTLIIKSTPVEAQALKKKLVPVLERGQDIEINPQKLI